ncbi:Uncharacterized protein TCM_010484 [Theobroma cacao]|uniref:Uncharacterized protein n=1 Tax=Theobroma cacao TaxID=3641 RepID=A0A061E6H0_THECC|nr:Uncharacterized protein TCM_010484 [Theobroma cacao]
MSKATWLDVNQASAKQIRLVVICWDKLVCDSSGRWPGGIESDKNVQNLASERSPVTALHMPETRPWLQVPFGTKLYDAYVTAACVILKDDPGFLVLLIKGEKPIIQILFVSVSGNRKTKSFTAGSVKGTQKKSTLSFLFVQQGTD